MKPGNNNPHNTSDPKRRRFGRRRRVAAVLLCTLAAGCVTAPPEAVAPRASEASTAAISHNNLYATLYLQTAAEHKALCRVVYRAAEAMLDEALADRGWTGALEQSGDFGSLPTGIIFDVDETVLDNSPYQATLISENLSYRTEHWDRWVAEAKAPAIQGAVEFAQAAVNRGVTLLFVTNRRCIQREPGGDPCPQRAETMTNLVLAGFPKPDLVNVILRSAEFDFARDKQSRRAALAGNYRILMLFGDDLGDFLPGVKEEGVDAATRDALVQQNASRWGRSWFVLPNPSYGSWLDVLGDEPAVHLRPWIDER